MKIFSFPIFKEKKKCFKEKNLFIIYKIYQTHENISKKKQKKEEEEIKTICHLIIFHQ